MATPPHYILVTGATGFIGAHVVDVLLSRGLRVRGATRSLAKGHLMMQSRPQYASKLDFVQVPDFAEGGDFSEAVKDVDAVVHVASPFSYDTKDNEKELILPAIVGVKAILAAAASNPNITRLVLTSSFASVMDANRSAPPYFTYTGNDWNPLTYAEAAAPSAPAFLAYRGSKLFAERAAWDFVAARNPAFSLVTLCPPMTFGPVVHPVASVDKLNESNAVLWRIAGGESPLPVARVPFWIDVRDLALAHVEALLRPGVGGQRFVPAASERFSYGRAASIMVDEFDWAKSKVQVEAQAIDESHGLDGQTAAEVLGLEYRSFKQTVVDLVRQAYEMDAKANQSLSIWKPRSFPMADLFGRFCYETLDDEGDGDGDDVYQSTRRRRYAIHVQLPRWLFGRAWDYQVVKSAAGWRTNLQVWNIRPVSSVFQYALEGELELLREMFNKGIALPFDRTQDGFNLLHMAAMGSTFEVFKALLTMGVDAYAQDGHGLSAVQLIDGSLFRWYDPEMLDQIVRVNRFLDAVDVWDIDHFATQYHLCRFLKNPCQLRLYDMVSVGMKFSHTMDDGQSLPRRLQPVYEAMSSFHANHMRLVLRLGPDNERIKAVDNSFEWIVLSTATEPKLLELRYGPRPEDWNLIWDMDIEELACDFWEMIDEMPLPMPGAWVDD
ncbi:hypothetical protein VdG2_04077 [Verticillium dahliae VDG2]|nr:hypothetical protein VdG2_04077 [Verticillium dahliae VDG2]